MRVNYIPVCFTSATSSRKFHDVKRFLVKFAIVIKLFVIFLILISLYLGGVFAYMFEESYTNFKYPVHDLPDIRGIVDKIENYEANKYGDFGVSNSQSNSNKTGGARLVGFEAVNNTIENLKNNGDISSRVNPLSQYDHLDFLLDVNQSCTKQWAQNVLVNEKEKSPAKPHTNNRDYVTIVMIVKSAVNYYERREAIRKTWYLNGMIGSYNFKTVFMVGACDQKNPVPSRLLKSKGLSAWTPEDCRNEIKKESIIYGDIIQSSGIDSYYNNTVKTFMTLRWIHERCPTDYVLAIDDDYVLEIDNFLDYMATIAKDYLPSQDVNSAKMNSDSNNNSSGTQSGSIVTKIIDISTNEAPVAPQSHLLTNNSIIALQRLSKQYFWSGYLLDHVRPLRSYLSKWYISTTDYPYDKYPVYLTGGMHLMSAKTARHLYYGTYFTLGYIFDDVYLGIIAKKVHIQATSNQEFKCSIREYLLQKPIRPNLTQCSGVHDMSAKSLLKLWEIRKQVASGVANVEVDFNALV